MKIQINPNETYEIGFPSEISKEKFLELASRLNLIQRLLGRDEIVDMLKSSKMPLPKTKNPKSVPHKFNPEARKIIKQREVYIDMLKSYYLDTPEDFMKKSRYYKIENYITSKQKMGQGGTLKLRDKLQIQPHEIGLKQFPTRANREIVKL
jgi:hypothetical protein